MKELGQSTLAEYRRRKEKRPDPLLHFFEAWEDSTGHLQTRSGIVSYSKVNDWLELKNDYQIISEACEIVSKQEAVLRLIACDFAQSPFSIGCGRAIFDMVKVAFNLNENSEDAILNNNGAFGRFVTRSPSSVEVDTFDLLIKVANCINIGYDALSMSHNLRTKSTRAFIHGLIDDEILRLFRYLQHPRQHHSFHNPFLLPSQILRSHRAKTEAHRSLVDDSLHRTEIQIGYAIPGILQERQAHYFRDQVLKVESLEFERITRRLHSCSTELGAVIHAGNLGKELGVFLLKTAEELKQITSKNTYSNSGGYCHNDDSIQQMEYATGLYTSLLSQTSILRERVQNHINLTFSLIAQDENRISRSVAEESAMIAVASKRDSAAMKTIALLTIIFLPPTFVATFFSMTMFDWTPEPPSSQITSKYFWVYWAVSIPLTALTLIIWRVWMSFENKQYRTELTIAKQERQRGYASGTLNATQNGAIELLRKKYSEHKKNELRHRGAVSAPTSHNARQEEESVNIIERD